MTLHTTKITIRRGERRDLPATLELIRELALYEKAPNEVTISLRDLEEDGFGSQPLYLLWVAEQEGTVIGIALCYVRYSTWKGRMLYLEDLVVKEHLRGQGIGHALFETCARFARDNQYRGMIWQVLDWNEPAIRFYKKYNAILDPEWLNGKLTAAQLAEFV